MSGWRLWVWGCLAGVTLLLTLVLCLGPIADLRWARARHETVALGESDLRVPFGWRSVEPGDGHGGDEAELLLQRGRWGWTWGRLVDEIDLRKARAGFDPVDLAQRWDRAETQSMIPGDRLEPAPAAPFLREHYRCSDTKRAEDGTISFGCFERDARWAVWYRGRRGGVRDLVMILESATDAGTATR